jgi:predicted nucleic acid-binding protein
MSRIFWDTNLFVYLFEGRGPSAERVAELRRRMVERHDELLTSTLTLGEILVKPFEAGDEPRAQRYRRAVSDSATILAFSEAAAPHYARIRLDRTVRPPDAIQLACAAAAGIDLFITNDERLSRKTVPGVEFVTSLERAFL